MGFNNLTLSGANYGGYQVLRPSNADYQGFQQLLTLGDDPAPSGPEPTLSSLSSSSASQYDNGISINLTGTNYTVTSVGRVNGANRTTTYNSPTSLTIAIPKTDFYSSGTLNIDVTDSSGTSSTLPFTVNAWNGGTIANVKSWYRGDTVTLNGSTVSQWDDKTGNGFHVTQATASSQPTYNASSSNFTGKPSLSFATDDRLQASTAADWAFMSDGTGFTALVAYRHTSSSASQNQALFATNAMGGTQRGVALAINTGTTPLTTGSATTFFSNGTTFTLNNQGAGTLQGNVDETVIWRFKSGASPEWLLKRKGNTTVTSRAIAPTPAVGTPHAALCIGALSSFGNFGGEIAEVVMVQDYLSAADETRWYNYCEAYYGIV